MYLFYKVYFMEVVSKRYYCYILGQVDAPPGKGQTYNGYTVNLVRRLRQHNGEIKGGAFATRDKGPWEFIAVFTSKEWTQIRAMQVEWLCRYPTRKKPRPTIYAGAQGRISSLIEICNRIEEPVDLYVIDKYFEDATTLNLPEHVTLCKVMDETF
jgi:predicted GIY-YIG superfamily endonuclease